MHLWVYIVIWYAIASAITFAVFAHDKVAAQTGGRRTPESTIHLMELLGGWGGTIAGMIILRHKIRKPSFWLRTAVGIFGHAVAWIAYSAV